MSFRKEEKLKIDKSKLVNLLDWINLNQGYELFESRIVSSTYFDNDTLSMFLDSEEGVVPRKKIRIRSYSEDIHNQYNSLLEMKTSSVEGRFKTSIKNPNIEKILSKGFFDSSYGICKPRVRVTYLRSYYQIYGIRLTIDQDIKYSKINTLGRSIYMNTDSDIIIELKANRKVPIEYLLRKFPFERVRFSKYCRAINSCICTT